MLLIEAADNPRPVHKLYHQTQHPKQDHYLESPRARPEPVSGELVLCYSKIPFGVLSAQCNMRYIPDRLPGEATHQLNTTQLPRMFSNRPPAIQ